MKKTLTFIDKYQTIIISYAISVALFLVVALLRPGYADISNIKVIAMDCSILGIACLGQTLVILTGGLDFSVPWVFTSSAFYMAMLCGGSDLNIFPVFLLVLGICVLMGLANGFGVAYLRISPVIMTLGTNAIFMGMLMGITGGKPYELPDTVQAVCTGAAGNVPNLLIIWIVVIIVGTLLLSKTSFGRQIYAVGNNETVALFSGINTRKVKMAVYMISSLCAGLAGILFAGRLGQLYFGMGDPFQMQTIAAVAVGGASLMGGSGSYIGTVAGTITLVVLTGLLAAFNLQTSTQEIIYGAVLLLAVFLSRKRVAEK